MRQPRGIWIAGVALAAVLWGAALQGMEPESQRLARAKDLIAEEQWMRAVEELRAAAKDPKESRRDEVLYWLAHSLNQAGNALGSLDTITQLEQRHPSSLWVKPARSLRLEIAMRMGRSDVLWRTALPSPPPAPPAPAPAPAPRAVPPPHDVAVAPPAPPPPTPPPVPAQAPPAPGIVWIPESFHPDAELRIQALGHLIRLDAEKAIPLLKDMVFEAESPGVASRAVFVLAQSQRPEARRTVVEVARSGPAPVRVAAVRELARFGGPEATKDLMQVYTVADVDVKLQVVRSLGERWARAPLLTIAETETNPELKTGAIMSLGIAGGARELRLLYSRVSATAKRSIVRSLFNASAEAELVQLAEHENDRTLRNEIIGSLRLLGTPKAKQYLEKIGRHE